MSKPNHAYRLARTGLAIEIQRKAAWDILERYTRMVLPYDPIKVTPEIVDDAAERIEQRGGWDPFEWALGVYKDILLLQADYYQRENERLRLADIEAQAERDQERYERHLLMSEV